MADFYFLVTLINIGNQEFDRFCESGIFSVNHAQACVTGPACFHLFLQPQGWTPPTPPPPTPPPPRSDRLQGQPEGSAQLGAWPSALFALKRCWVRRTEH